ncbi:MAG TPA: DUF1549 domain-containing protein, partial [Chthonomonadaceae bacterium]|nr:DUF1549 domain-containing protein [Chthonomonadaceae bacterium]
MSALAAPARKAVRLEAAPSAIRLAGPAAVQHILVTAVLPDGTRRDVTDECAFASATPKVAALNGRAEVVPAGDGSGWIRASWRGAVIKIPVTASGARQALRVSFTSDVVPILSRQGCSSGACHGAAQGKGGFRLSLRGYAPEIDFASITRALGGRRISRENPEASLFLRKPLGELPHRGGLRLVRGSREHSLLLAWLRQGAPGPDPRDPALARVDILPGDREMRAGDRQRLLVRATFSDGHTEDVTERALYAANDVAIATVSDDGLATLVRPGETAITARYMDKLAVARFTAPFRQPVRDSAFKAANNYIDTLVNAKLKQLHIEPSGLCTDQEFLRRAYIDAIGTLPPAEEASAFLADQSPDRRSKLIESLLRRPEYGEIWALKFGDLFVLRREYMHRKYAMEMQQWLAEQFNANTPWDKLVTAILTASGPLEESRGGFFFVSRTPQKPGEGSWIRAAEPTAEMVAQDFLGARIGCAKCHNHPTERYTQDDYYHFAALWQQVHGKGGNDDGVPEILDASANGDVRQPRTGELMAPRP